jgi:hypothetical protein
MPQENVEIVRRIYEEDIFDRDVDRLLDEFASPDIEYVNPPEAVDPGTRQGRAEFAYARETLRPCSTRGGTSFTSCSTAARA